MDIIKKLMVHIDKADSQSKDLSWSSLPLSSLSSSSSLFISIHSIDMIINPVTGMHD